jgi:quinolinate synthase
MIQDEIQRLKKEKNMVVLAHYYQKGEIQDVADYIGDSLGLSQEAAKTQADYIVFAGVHFMAETAKILSPNKRVLLPDLLAGCSLADTCPAPDFKRFKDLHPNHTVIMYVNSTAEIKAMSDIVCTSSNAVAIVDSLPKEEKIIFGPDKNLGAYVAKKTGRDLVLWNGSCMVHDQFSREKIEKLKNRNPEAEIIAHPECEEIVLKLADFIGSTTALLKYTEKSKKKEFIVATEPGILHQMEKISPDKVFFPAPPNGICACNECPHMKRNTLEKLFLCMRDENPEIFLSEEILKSAQWPIQRMLDISAKFGL